MANQPTWIQLYIDQQWRVSSTDELLGFLPSMVGATSLLPGTRGLVPAPAAGDQLKFLKGDGTWSAPDLTGIAVTSFNGRTGAVSPQGGDYTAAQVGAVALTSVNQYQGVLGIDASGNVAVPGNLSVHGVTYTWPSSSTNGVLTNTAGTLSWASYVPTSLIGAVNGVATLDGSGKVPVAQLPATAINNTYVVANQAAMLALAANVGDIAVRTDLSETFILQTAGASTLANWVQLLFPTASGVTSFNGRTGAVAPTSGDYSAAQITGLAAVATSGSATDLTTGTLNVLRLPTVGGLTPGAYTSANVTVDTYGRITAITNGAGSSPQLVEIQTATAGQTDFTLSTMSTTGLAVYVDGAREDEFSVISSSVIRFARAKVAGQKVLFEQGATTGTAVIPNSMLAPMAASTIKGNATAGFSAPQDLTGAQVVSILPTFGTSANGLVPAPGSALGKFLRDDGTWQVVSAGPSSDLHLGTPAYTWVTGGTFNVASLGPLSGIVADSNIRTLTLYCNAIATSTPLVADVYGSSSGAVAVRVTAHSFNVMTAADGTAGAAITWHNLIRTSMIDVSTGLGYVTVYGGDFGTVNPGEVTLGGGVVRATSVYVGGLQAVGQSSGVLVPQGPLLQWLSIACSTDGSKLVAVGFNRATVSTSINLSSDAGATWTSNFSIGIDSAGRAGCAMSADGSKLLVGIVGAVLYASTDSGATWGVAYASANGWTAVAMSADGTKLFAASAFGYIYVSTDSGTNWTARGPMSNWSGIACSADGTKLVATSLDGEVFLSTDSGTTWTAATGLPAGYSWRGCASSASGTVLSAVSLTAGACYLSTDSGASWTNVLAPEAQIAVGISSSGTTLVAASLNSPIQVSTDSGATWSPQGSARPWAGLSISADATKIYPYDAALGWGLGHIYASGYSLALGQTSGDFASLSVLGKTLTGEVFTTSTAGLVPAPGSTGNNFLRDDGTWQYISSGVSLADNYFGYAYGGVLVQSDLYYSPGLGYQLNSSMSINGALHATAYSYFDANVQMSGIDSIGSGAFQMHLSGQSLYLATNDGGAGASLYVGDSGRGCGMRIDSSYTPLTSATSPPTSVSISFGNGQIKLGTAATNLGAAPSVTGSKGGNVALTNLLTQLASMGLITNSTT